MTPVSVHDKINKISPVSPYRNTGPILPSLREVVASVGTSTTASSMEEHLSHWLDRMKLSSQSNDDCVGHVALICDLLMTINGVW